MKCKDIWVDEFDNVYDESPDEDSVPRYFHEDDAICRSCYNDLKDGLKKIAAAAGHPDGAQACRNILAIIKEIS